MLDPHRIRLHGPWEYQVLSGTLGGRKPSGKQKLPSDWADILGAEFQGTVRYRRRFGKPARLDLDESVWLVVDGVSGIGKLTLNARVLGRLQGPEGVFSTDITDQLHERNELWLDVTFPSCDAPVQSHSPAERERRSGGPIGEIRLEIRIDQGGITPIA